MSMRLNAGTRKVATLTSAGKTFQAGEVQDELTMDEKRKYQAGVGKLLYIARWSKPDISNAVPELSRF